MSRLCIHDLGGKSYGYLRVAIAVFRDPLYKAGMHVFYFDESGCTTPLLDPPSIHLPPLIVISGVAIDGLRLRDLTRDFIELKRRFFPRLRADGPHRLSWILSEVKGADLRRKFGKAQARNPRRTATMFIGEVINLLERYDAKIMGRVWIKGIGAPMKSVAVYAASVQYMFRSFNSFLMDRKSLGMVIGDSRDAGQNAEIAHGIFTQKHSNVADHYTHIVELPTFGHSLNSAGLQIADIVASGILFPMAIATYCSEMKNNVHVRPGYREFQERYAKRIKALQYSFKETDGKNTGGIIVCDNKTRKSSCHLFLDRPEPFKQRQARSSSMPLKVKSVRGSPNRNSQ